MTTKIKKTSELYYSPTPAKWRKIGDSLLACAALIGGGGLISFDYLREIFEDKELKIIIGVVIIVGVAGKFITNFFKEETK